MSAAGRLPRHRPRDDPHEGRPASPPTASRSASGARRTRWTSTRRPGRAEQDPEAWWAGLGASRSARRSTRRARRRGSGRRARSRSASSGTGRRSPRSMPTGRPVRPAITWLDTRADRASRRELEAATGLRGWALGVLPAALWLERHEPEAAARARWYLNSWEALALRLTGSRPRRPSCPAARQRPATRSTAPGSRSDRVAPEVSAGTVLGGLTPEAATPPRAARRDAGRRGARRRVRELPRRADARSRAMRSTSAARPAASASTPTARSRSPVASRRPRRCPGLYSVGGAMAATGAALDWFASESSAAPVSIDDLIDEAAAIEPGADGLVFLPYLAGERSPLWDPTRARRLRRPDAPARPRAPRPGDPRGRRARDPPRRRADARRRDRGHARCAPAAARRARDAWNQIKADVTGFTVEVPRVRETAAVGAAIVAAVGVGRACRTCRPRSGR